MMFGLGFWGVLLVCWFGFFFTTNTIHKLQEGGEGWVRYRDLKFRNVQFRILISEINIPVHEEDRGK